MDIIPVHTRNLAAGDYHFNAALFNHREETYMAYRVNQGFHKAEIYINRVNDKYHGVGEPILLNIPNVTGSAFPMFEDPRMFWYNRELYCAFTFLRIEGNAQNQGLVKLGRHFQVEELWYLDYKNNRNAAILNPRTVMHPGGYLINEAPTETYEKNWQFFEHKGSLNFVYQIKNHLVAEADLENSNVSAEYIVKKPTVWSWGELRGGTPPVLIDRKYWSFFHSSMPYNKQGKKLYHMGVYVFDAKPPFKPRLISSEPILSGNPKAKKVLWKNVAVFPCGAIFNGTDWVVSYGYNDYCIKVAKINHQWLKETLQPT
jgi:predicted GH43/DUF377 family glycosyl hydrolase